MKRRFTAAGWTTGWGVLPGLALLIGVIYVVASPILLSGFESVETHETGENVERLDRALNSVLAKFDSLALSWTQWDEAWQYVLQKNPRADAEFEASNLSDSGLAQLESHFVLYAGLNGKTIYATGYDPHAAQRRPLPQGIQAHIARNSLLFRHRGTQSRTQGLVMLPQGPMLVVSRPVLSGSASGPIRGTLVLGRFLDRDLIRHLSEQLQLPVALQNVGDRKQPDDFRRAHAALLAKPAGARPQPVAPNTFVRELDGKTIAGYLLINDIYGKPALIGRVAMPRHISQQGQTSLRYLLIALLSIGAVSGLVLAGTQNMLARSQRKNREDEQLYRLLTLNSSDLLYLLDVPTGRLTLYGDVAGALGCAEDAFAAGQNAWLECVHPEDRVRVEENRRRALETGSAYSDEYRIRHEDGSYRYWLDRGKPLFDEKGRPSHLVGACTDITERKKSELEKEVLLKEIHHRVKNNMQVISSMLNLQSSHAPDRHTIEMFRDAQNRIKSMALIHERLYRQHDLASVDFSEYLRQLTGHLMRSYRVGAIQLDLQLQPLALDIDAAVPCGLIVNELISNALKHAFAGRRAGVLTLALHIVEDADNAPDGKHTLRLMVADDGVGIPAGFDWRDTDSLGLQLTLDFVDQIGGAIELENDGLPNEAGGTRWIVTFAAACRSLGETTTSTDETESDEAELDEAELDETERETSDNDQDAPLNATQREEVMAA